MYDKFLDEIPVLKDYLLKRELLRFSSSSRSKFQLLLNQLCNQSIENSKIHLCENLAKSNNEWNYMLEFKPKTPLPDVYSLPFLRNFTKKNSLPLDGLFKILRNSPNE